MFEGLGVRGPILVILAGGMGSRYGGLKQIDRIGQDGEVLMDYSVFDALRAGYKKVVFIIRHDIEKDFTDVVLSRIKGKVDYNIAYQELDSLITDDIKEFFGMPCGGQISVEAKSKRTKPWGTAHALLCAKPFIDAPFSVINADDFYGKHAYEVMGKFLLEQINAASTADSVANAPQTKTGAIVPYTVEKTLSGMGTVTRGVCKIEGSYLASVDEWKLIEKKNGMIINTFEDGSTVNLAADTPVSMNFWGLTPDILPDFKKYFDEFLINHGKEEKSECYIPLAIDNFIKTAQVKIKSLDCDSEWFGVTYKADRDAAIKRIASLTEQGVYPKSLW
ncbi:MAG: nucleotidyltransferase [Termitinemataceae bacterium]|nr:MAG: nucleotidyltransferase [Termitinemataceae bacterium]